MEISPEVASYVDKRVARIERTVEEVRALLEGMKATLPAPKAAPKASPLGWSQAADAAKPGKWTWETNITGTVRLSDRHNVTQNPDELSPAQLAETVEDALDPSISPPAAKPAEEEG